MMKKSLLALFAALFCTLSGFAAELKIAVFDLEKVFQSYNKTKISESFINSQREEYQKYLESLNAELLKFEEEFKVLRDSSQNIAFDPIEREKKRQAAESKSREIQYKRAEMENYAKDKSRQFQEVALKRRNDILADITSEVKKRAVVEGYTLVLDISSRGVNTDMPTVIYFSETLDITANLIEELNRGNAPQLQKPEAPAAPEAKPAVKPEPPAPAPEEPVAAPAPPAAQ